MKKLIVLLLTVLLCLSMAACSKENSEKTDENSTETVVEEVPKERTEEEILAEDYDAWTFEDVLIYTPKTLNMKEIELENYEFSLGGDEMILFISHIDRKELLDLGYEEADLIDAVFEGTERQTAENGVLYYFYNNSVEETEYFYGYGLLITEANYWDIHTATNADMEETVRPVMTDIYSRLAENR